MGTYVLTEAAARKAAKRMSVFMLKLIKLCLPQAVMADQRWDAILYSLPLMIRHTAIIITKIKMYHRTTFLIFLYC